MDTPKWMDLPCGEVKLVCKGFITNSAVCDGLILHPKKSGTFDKVVQEVKYILENV